VAKNGAVKSHVTSEKAFGPISSKSLSTSG
jgi:hypothetical protein